MLLIFCAYVVEPTVVGECLDILKELAFVIPSFWANDEVVLVLSLYMDSAASQGANLQGLDGLVKTLTKRLPPALLIPTLCGMWPAEGISVSSDMLDWAAILMCSDRTRGGSRPTSCV